MSARNNFKRRNVIRETYGKGFDNVYFLVGDSYCPYAKNDIVVRSCQRNRMDEAKIEAIRHGLTPENSKISNSYSESESVQRELREQISQLHLLYYDEQKLQVRENAISVELTEESKKYNDIILVDQMDTYTNLTIKMLDGFIKAFDEFKEINFFVKTDDDTYVKINRLQEMLKNTTDYWLGDKSQSSAKTESSNDKVGLKPSYPTIQKNTQTYGNFYIGRLNPYAHSHQDIGNKYFDLDYKGDYGQFSLF